MMRYEKYKKTRFWAVYNETNELVSICVYKRGAIAIITLILELQGYSKERIAEVLLSVENAYKAAI